MTSDAAAKVIDRGVVLVMVACSLLYALFIWRPSFVFRGQRWFTLFDDGMISMTYARNLAEGHGLVWNVGGPAVEGYTNPLWTFVMAALHRIGLSEALVPLAVSIVSAGLVLGCMALAACLARRLRPASRYGPRLAALFVGLYYPLVYWALRGMEVGLVTFLVLAAVVLALRLHERVAGRDIALLCAVVGAGLLTRDDFVVPAVVVGVWLLICLKGRARWTVAVPLVVTGLVVIGGQTAFRLAYYGEPLPNTYYLKVSGQPIGPRWWRGLMTLVALVLADAVFLFAMVAGGLAGEGRANRAGRRITAPIALVLSIAGALAVYSVYVGGDAWEWARLANRYLTPAGVLLLALMASLVEPLVARVRAARRPIFWGAAVLATGLAFGLVDSFVGVSLGVLNDYLGNAATSVTEADLTIGVLLVVLVVAFLAGGTRRLPKRLASGAVPVVLVGLVVLMATAGNTWTSWAGDGGFYTARNQGALAYGLELGDLTYPGATIAVIWAGAPIYYSHRDGVDLLGKMDPVIAHGPHHEGIEMYPGHDKFDFDYSIGVLRPDLIAQYAWFSQADLDKFYAEGYIPVKPVAGVADDLTVTDANGVRHPLDVPRAQLWVRSDSKRVHPELVQPVPPDAVAGTVER